MNLLERFSLQFSTAKLLLLTFLEVFKAVQVTLDMVVVVRDNALKYGKM